MTTPRFRQALPHLERRWFLTDGGIETHLIFNEGIELPDFASFHLLRSPQGTAALRRYFDAFVDLAVRHGTGLLLESVTWRASADWGARLGYSPEELAEANRRAIAMLEDVRAAFEAKGGSHAVLSGCLGPRGDGYNPAQRMTAAEAERYHAAQIATLADTAADMLSAMTINYVEEAIGIARAAKRAGMPLAISFTVETDGKLPTGQSLADAIRQVDDATSGGPVYYMLNCAHPTHFAHVLEPGAPWVERLRGVRANASSKSHEELNESAELDIGHPPELGTHYAELTRRFPHLTILGGCCGTDARHIDEIAKACVSRAAP